MTEGESTVNMSSGENGGGTKIGSMEMGGSVTTSGDGHSVEEMDTLAGGALHSTGGSAEEGEIMLMLI